MKGLELHEQILVYLYNNRNNDAQYDLFIKFKNISKTLVFNKATELADKGLIATETSEMGIGSFSWDTGEITFPNAGEPYLKAKIRNEGIQYVKQNILKNTNWGNVFHKTVETICLVATAILGIMLYVREERHNKTEALLRNESHEKDSTIQQNKKLNEVLADKEKQIRQWILKYDSLDRAKRKK